MNSTSRAFRTTGEVARALGVPENLLQDLFRYRRMCSPPISAGRRIWQEQHVEEARQILESRGAIASPDRDANLPSADPEA